MLKVTLFAILLSMLAVLMKSIGVEYSFLIAFVGAFMLAFILVGKLKIVMDTFHQIQEKSGVSWHYMKLLFKIIGISFLGDFTANICKDAGQVTLAKQVEMFCKLSILIVSLPVLQALLQMIETLMES